MNWTQPVSQTNIKTPCHPCHWQ